MCGRYALALRPSQVRAMLQDENMPVYDAPDDDGNGAPRQSYNFAPGYYGVVYRADVPDWGAGPARDAATRGHEHGHTGTRSSARGKQQKDGSVTSSQKSTRSEAEEDAPENTSAVVNNNSDSASEKQQQPPHYILQSMKWGLIPFWTKRNPDYGAMLKTINCRDDSLATTGGMWSTMKARKRCLVVAQGFYEWLKPAHSKEKSPHYIKRKDGKLMLLAGLWDCVVYDQDKDKEEEDGKEKNYTYTIITTDSNKQLRFLHDRMPVIFDPGSEEVRIWLDPGRHEWSNELQGLLKPWAGELEVYPVSKEVGKVGNNSPSFIIPVASRENKGNIANFFAAAGKQKAKKDEAVKEDESDAKDVEVKKEVKKEEDGEDKKTIKTEMESVDELQDSVDDGGMFASPSPKKGVKRERETSPEAITPKKVKLKQSLSPSFSQVQQQQQQSSATKSGSQGQRSTISATKNPQRKTPIKSKGKGKTAPPSGSQKITKFFGNSA
ncbi:putative ACR, COG2135 domain containing protein [Naviculisporaceae sp. PSN 640]